MKKLKIFLKSEEFWIILLSLILLVFSYGLLVYNYLLPPPPGKLYLGSFGYPPDFWGKMISFQEGRLGHWLFIHKITTTIPTPPTITPIEYIFLGHLSRLFPVNPIVFLHFCRFLLTIALLFVSYRLISHVFNKKIHRLIAYSLALFSTGVGKPGANLMELWSPVSVFQRSAYFPHYLFAFIFLLLSILFLGQALEKKNLKKLFLASFFGFLTSLIHAPNTVSLYFALAFYALIIISLNLQQKINLKRWIYKVFFLFVYFVVSVLPIVYLFFITQSYPWNILGQGDTKFDLQKYIHPQALFIFLIGPTLFLGIYGAGLIIKKIKEKNDLLLLLAPWSITYLLGFYFINKVSVYNSQRFIQTPFFVILAILSTLALIDLSARITKKLKINKDKALVVLTILVLSLSFSAIKKGVILNLENFKWTDNYLYYTNKENLEAINWLKKNTQEKDIVLADKVNGELIAALAGNYPYVNVEITNFPDEHYNLLEAGIRDFYRQSAGIKESQNFLAENKIRYVFWADEEKSLSSAQYLDYPFLIEVYSNPKVTIFELKR